MVNFPGRQKFWISRFIPRPSIPIPGLLQASSFREEFGEGDLLAQIPKISFFRKEKGVKSKP
jgi:hypothetical protein